MTHQISIPTPFADIAELAESFASRVDEERLMLPHSEPVPEGEWVQFEVTLGDGTVGLAGTGCCTGAFDNGEDRAAEHRYDVVMDQLQFDEMSQIYFERILNVRATQMGEEPVTGQVAVPEELAAEEPAYEAPAYEEPAYEEPPAAEPPPMETVVAAVPDAGGASIADEGEFEEATQAVSFDEFGEAQAELAAAPEAYAVAEAPPVYEEPAPEPAYEEPAQEVPVEAAPASIPPQAESEEYALQSDALEFPEEDALAPAASAGPTLAVPEQSAIYELPPPQEPGPLPSPHSVQAVLTRRVLMSSWSPEPALRPDPGPSSGYFAYAVGAGLPFPASPPRPDLDPSLRLRPAPRPGDPHQVAVERTSAAPAAEYAADAYEAADPHAAEEGYGDYAEADVAEGAPADGYEGGYEEPDGEYAAEDGEYAAEDGEYAAEDGEYAAEGYDENATVDADFAGLGEHEQPTREVDIAELPDASMGDETLQVAIPDEDD